MSNSYYDINEKTMTLPHGVLKLPVYFPDATYGYVRSMAADDLYRCGIQGLVMNAFHLMRKPGTRLIKKMKGLHNFFFWERPIVTDSGGFQVYSLIRENKKHGSINKDGIIFRPEGGREKLLITPEKIIQVQMGFGSDIAVCLDDCTHSSDSPEINRLSVERTVDWGVRCRKEFDTLLDRKDYGENRPRLFAVVQGGGDFALRKECAERLLEIGFDGYGFGGYPLNEEGELLRDILEYVRELVPREYPLFALGIGHPRNIVDGSHMGYGLFDCSLPTRDARSGRLFLIRKDKIAPGVREWFSYLYMADKKHFSNENPVDPECGCFTCSRYSIAFLHHLYKKSEPLYYRLATIHNLSAMGGVMEYVQEHFTG